ncbi:MAG: hypothetical protein MI799_14205, partial [Desulfobacterales bacterium]|nr:hypothetical protein [Desulfobacterales bacterium]
RLKKYRFREYQKTMAGKIKHHTETSEIAQNPLCKGILPILFIEKHHHGYKKRNRTVGGLTGPALLLLKRKRKDEEIIMGAFIYSIFYQSNLTST